MLREQQEHRDLQEHLVQVELQELQVLQEHLEHQDLAEHLVQVDLQELQV